MPDTELQPVVRRMALTHREFLRSLPKAAPEMECRIDGAQIDLSAPPRRVSIFLGPERTRTLGSLVLPEIEVHLRYEGFAQDELKAFLERFDLAFRRGGG